MRTIGGDDDSYDDIVKKFGDTMIKIWRNDAGQIHRADYPAVITSDKNILFCYNGKLALNTDKYKGNECSIHQ